MGRPLSRRACLLGAVWLALASVPSAPVWGQSGGSQDPVEDLRNVLPIRLEELNNPADIVVQFRREILEKKAAALKTIGDLRRALVLDEWKIDPQRIANDRIRKIDLEVRQKVGERLIAAIRAAAKSSDPNTRLSVANLIAEMGPTIPALDPMDRNGFTRTLTPEVAQLAKDPDLGVRQEALRALGNINPDPKAAVKVFMAVFDTDPAVGPKRLAADSLGQLIRVVAHLQKRGRTAVGVEATRGDVIAISREIFVGAVPGVRDADAEVRTLSLIAVQIAAQTLADQVPDAFSRRDFPPEGRKLTEGERKDILARYAEVRANIEDVRPMMLALREAMPIISKSIQDPDARVRMIGIQTMENVGNARLRMKKRLASLPSLSEPKEEVKGGSLTLMEGLDPLESFLATELQNVPKLLNESDLRIRRSTVEFMEMLESDAAPIASALETAMADSDRLVRASAAKVAGLLPPAKAEPLAASLGRLLLDNDLQVRIVAGATLEAMGSYAKEAVPSMAQALGQGDAEGRLAVMYALQRVGPEVAKSAAPHLAQLLTHSDARILKAAAETLGRIGPAAQLAIPGLRRLLGNEDAEVRIAASEAILAITAP